ncbi:MAG: ribosome-binding factor [candidate division NC10 bacterium]|nr:ribosome-binding factor [candidate division NC10 bacterium]
MSEVRQKRVESLVQEQIAQLINRKTIKDPRVQPLAVVTRVSASKDLKYCKVYISFYGDPRLREECVAALNHAAGFIQRQLGERLRLRFVPKLTFIEDFSIEQGFRVMQKLRELSPE